MENIGVKNKVVIERIGHVLRFTLNNPENENHITGEMFEQMFEVLKQEKDHPNARVLHIRANGDVFCTGRERAGTNSKEIRKESERLIRFKQLLREAPLITIAEVQGKAEGFGFGMAIVCDFVITAEDAGLGFPEMKMGLAPAAIMSYLGEYTLPRHAFSMVLTGDLISPKRAVEIGLINESVPKEQLSERVEQYINNVLELDETAARVCKEFFHTSMKNSFEQNVRLAIDALTLGSLSVMERQNSTK
jgi:methylglutaconyl-CoA hydratase